ncbi:uncharacterized protein [Arachis hypogaea]|uniref:uncharacterized protein isoform X4 n=1 Tax=Arachis hypogaea TaxID=3818 RepID=UPI003B214394
MPSFFFNHEEDPDFLQMLRDQFSNIDKADWVLYNSFYKLEKQENVNTRHPQLLYESKLYRILQGRTRSAEQSRLQRRTGANLFDRAEERGNGEFDGAARASLTAQQGRRRRR